MEKVNYAASLVVGIFPVMRLLFVADGRSPITRSWLQYWIERGDRVHLASTFACEPLSGLDGLSIVPAAFSAARDAAGRSASTRRNPIWGARTLQLRAALRHWLGPLSLPRAGKILRDLVDAFRPDLVHALRIPYEGMLAANAGLSVPLVVSVWGNDFTLHAPASPLMRQHTRWTMLVADALTADCQRDVRLAREWGLDADKPTLVVPGNGGLDLSIFHPPSSPADGPLVVNPRGFRAYVRNDTFFRAIPLILASRPDVRFACPAMAGEPQAEAWLDELGIRHAVELMPSLPRPGLADLFRRAQVLVSPSTHDGTPNSLLEGMACGCFPVAGDLESIREWINPGMNGLLVDPSDPQALATAVLTALENADLRSRAREHNTAMIAARAGYRDCMAQVEGFYQRLV